MMPIVRMIAWLPLLTYSFAQNLAFIPPGDTFPNFTLSVAGVGPNEETTYIQIPTSTSSGGGIIPTITFIEGPSVLIVPTVTITTASVDPSGSTSAATIIEYESCALGSNNVGNCFNYVSKGSEGSSTVMVSAVINHLTSAVVVEVPASLTASRPASDTIALNSSPTNSSSHKSNLPAIVGGTIGGVVALIVIVFHVTLLILRRRHHRAQMDLAEDDYRVAYETFHPEPYNPATLNSSYGDQRPPATQRAPSQQFYTRQHAKKPSDPSTISSGPPPTDRMSAASLPTPVPRSNNNAEPDQSGGPIQEVEASERVAIGSLVSELNELLRRVRHDTETPPPYLAPDARPPSSSQNRILELMDALLPNGNELISNQTS